MVLQQPEQQPHREEPKSESSSPAHILPSRPSPIASPELRLAIPDLNNNSATVPQGLDQASFLAGERAAYSRAFTAALPSHQALGELFKAVEVLHTRIEGDSSLVRSLHTDHIRSETQLAIARQRLSHIEESQIPSLQHRIDAVADRPGISPEISEALQHLRDVLRNLCHVQDRYIDASSRIGNTSTSNQLYWLFSTAIGYTIKALSKADIALLFLSKKILMGSSSSSHHGLLYSRTYNSHTEYDATSATTSSTSIAKRSILKRKAETVLSTCMFIASIELAWRIHQKTTASLPKSIQRLNSPLKIGLKVARTVVWSSAFIVTLDEVRRMCRKIICAGFSGIDVDATSGELLRSMSPCRNSPSLEGESGDGEVTSPLPADTSIRDNELYTP